MNPHVRAYFLDSPPAGTNDYAYANFIGGGERTGICKACGALTDIIETLPLEIALYGRNIGDFVWSDGNKVMVGKRLLSILSNNSLKGFNAIDVHIEEFYDNGEEVDLSEYTPGSLHYLQITGQGGRFRSATKGIETLKFCEVCGKGKFKPSYTPLIISRQEWDGSDIFRCEEFLYTFITEAFLNVLRVNEVANYEVFSVDMR